MEERSQKNAITVLRPLFVTEIFKHITELILERNPMEVTNVMKPLHVTVFSVLKEFILVRKPIGVNNVVEPFTPYTTHQTHYSF